MKTEIKTEIKQEGKAGVSPYTGRQMSRSLLEEFIITYRNHPCLWKIKCKDYLNKDLKYEAYRKLETICKKEHMHAGREFVVKKINSLRGSFRREYRRVITEEHYVPQLWFYDLMQVHTYTQYKKIVFKQLMNLSRCSSRPTRNRTR